MMKVETYTFDTDPAVDVPIVIFKGKKPGKRGFICGGVHGDELNGMMLVKKFVNHFRRMKLEKEMSGELIIFPLLNPTGFERARRRIYIDKNDLNRSYPGRKSGSFSEQFAYEFMHRFVKRCDFGVDCHDAGGMSSLLPHTRVGACVDEQGNCVGQNLGRLFGTEIIIERKGRKGMLALEAWKKFQVPVLTVEMGGAKHLFEDYLKDGVDGIKNILKFYKILPGEPTVRGEQFIIKGRFGVKAPITGIIELKVKLGDFVHYGDKIGTLYHPQTFQEVTVLAPMCGVIFSLHDHQIIRRKGIMFSILETKKCHVPRTTLEEFEPLGKFDVKKVVM